MEIPSISYLPVMDLMNVNIQLLPHASRPEMALDEEGAGAEPWADDLTGCTPAEEERTDYHSSLEYSSFLHQSTMIVDAKGVEAENKNVGLEAEFVAAVVVV